MIVKNIDTAICLMQKIRISSVILGVASTTLWMPAIAATATATVSADIISTINVGARNGLIFGDISSSSVAGTVILSTSGNRTTTGGATVNSSSSGSPATFDVSGDANASFSITLPVSITLSDGSSNNMIVDNFTSSPSPAGVLDSSGKQSLFVGATLNVSSNQPFGSYSGLMSVTVDYN
jgi:hypothetical protein